MYHRDFGRNGHLADETFYAPGAWIDFFNLQGEKLYGQIRTLDRETGRIEIVSKGTLHHLELV